MYNLDVLSSLPGELVEIKSKDTGRADNLETLINKFLTLKLNCRVMLLYNISDKLKNGSQGVFVGFKKDQSERSLLVNFPPVGTIAINQRTWCKYDQNGKIVATRTQFPLAPCYAITVHKAQSMTMDKIVVHCSQEFVPVQTHRCCCIKSEIRSFPSGDWFSK